MFGRIFPPQFDNDFQGARLATWLLAPLLFVRGMMGFNSIFFTRFVATSADGLDFSSFGPRGTEAVISLYGLLGVAMVLLSLIGVVALVRYRSMIPLLYLVLLIQQVAGKALSLWRPSERSAQPGGHTASAIVLAALIVTLVGFILSLWRSPRTRSQVAPEGSR
jgi:hypothetical protein